VVIAAAQPAMAGPTSLGALPGDTDSSNLTLSADGSVAVIQSYNANSNVWRAARWTQTGGLQDLTLPGYAERDAQFVSSDGSFIAGTAYSADGTLTQAYVWTSGAGLLALGFSPGDTVGSAVRASKSSTRGQYTAGTLQEVFGVGARECES
jgi:uncharacterized membrane protein